MTWKSLAFIVITSAVYPAFLVYQHLSGRDLRTLPLAYLSISSIVYIWYLVNVVYPYFFSPLRHLPEPANESFFLGHGTDISERPPGTRYLKWMKDTPNNGLIHFRGPFQHSSNLILTTPDSLTEVLNAKPYDWVKPASSRRFLSRVLGEGLVVVEGKEHKVQRKSVAPAFSGKNIRDLVPTFWSKARHFADVVADQMKFESTSEKGLRTGTTEIHRIAQRITLDIIGKAALGKDMDTVVDPSDELAQQYEVILHPDKGNLIVFVVLNMFAPVWFLRHFPWKMNQRIMESAFNLRTICRKIITEKRAAISEKHLEEKDILSMLIRTDQFNDDDLVDQLLTFLAAGHETTSSAFTWASYLLSLYPEVQSQLRREIQAIITESGMSLSSVTAETIDSMPYLHAVCSEVLRYYPTVPLTARENVRTTTIGDQVVPKGTRALVCQWAINRSPELWGPDAGQFNPDRWMPGKGNPQTGGADSRYSFLTFLHGPRSCIGQGFAITELKCLLAAVFLRFKMDLAREEDKRDGVEAGGFVTIKPREGLHVRLVELS